MIEEMEDGVVAIGGTGIHGIKCRCLIDEPYPCPWHGYDNRPEREQFLVLDFKTGHQTFVRKVNREFQTVEWKVEDERPEQAGMES